MATEPHATIIAGPNGQGKSTFAREFLPREGQCRTFVNADLIAAGLSPFAPEAAALQAGRIMLAEIAALVGSRASFVLESTLAGRGFLRALPRWRGAGYRIRLIFLKLSTPDIALSRVANRVRLGGHAIPEPIIRRRFVRGLANLPDYQAAVDDWRVFDNDGAAPILLASGGRP